MRASPARWRDSASESSESALVSAWFQSGRRIGSYCSRGVLWAVAPLMSAATRRLRLIVDWTVLANCWMIFEVHQGHLVPCFGLWAILWALHDEGIVASARAHQMRRPSSILLLTVVASTPRFLPPLASPSSVVGWPASRPQ